MKTIKVTVDIDIDENSTFWFVTGWDNETQEYKTIEMGHEEIPDKWKQFIEKPF